MKNFFYLFSLVLILTVACKKDTVVVNAGIYRGVFYYISTASSDTLNEGVCNLAIFDKKKNFSLSGDTATGIPKSCSGFYNIDETTITFVKTSESGEFFFDKNLELDTVYSYTFSDTASTFDMYLKTDTYTYSYRLNRN